MSQPQTGTPRRAARARWRVAGVVAVVVGLLLVGSGVVLLRAGDDEVAAPRPVTPTRTAEPPPYALEPAVRLRGKPKPTPPPVVAAAPSRLQVPALGLD